jgi:hypothetical protein
VQVATSGQKEDFLWQKPLQQRSCNIGQLPAEIGKKLLRKESSGNSQEKWVKYKILEE